MRFSCFVANHSGFSYSFSISWADSEQYATCPGATAAGTIFHTLATGPIHAVGTCITATAAATAMVQLPRCRTNGSSSWYESSWWVSSGGSNLATCSSAGTSPG